MANIVAIISRLAGTARTFMAAEWLQRGAETLEHTIKVETQGSVDEQNTLTEANVREADPTIITVNTKVEMSRFTGKPVYETLANAATKDGQVVVKEALAQVTTRPSRASKTNYEAKVLAAKAAQTKVRRGPYKHLLVGVSYMIPFVVVGGIMTALSYAVGGYLVVNDTSNSIGATFLLIGTKAGFLLFVPVLSGYIAYSIADRPGLAPGMIGGVLAGITGSGFLGGIIAGFLAGYTVHWLNRCIQLPRNFADIKPVLILPLLGAAIVGLLMIYVVGVPIHAANITLTNWLQGRQADNAVLLGLLLGLMTAFDMGGPVNKAAYTFSVGLLGSHIYLPMAAVMAAGMTPPLGLALATVLFKNRFTHNEREAGKAAWMLGLSFITEGAIPFAAEDPFRVIPSIMIGSAVAAGLSMLFACQLHVPHGGIWVVFIPNVVTNLPLYLLAIFIGMIVTTGALFVFKRPIATESEEEAPARPKIEIYVK